MRHIKLTTKSLPRAASSEDCCNCLDEMGDNRAKCDKLGRCEAGVSYICQIREV